MEKNKRPASAARTQEAELSAVGTAAGSIIGGLSKQQPTTTDREFGTSLEDLRLKGPDLTPLEELQMKVGAFSFPSERRNK